jgi:cytochrome c556
MNDDFLYRLRTEPPPHFADALKAQLERSARRTVRAWHFGLGVLLFGTAFAVALYWNKNAPAPAPVVSPTPQETQRGLGGAFGDRKVESPDEGVEPPAPSAPIDEAVKQAARALLEEEQAKRRLPVTLAPRPPQPETSAPTSTDTDAPDAQSEFIVTGPLLGEYGTPAYVFETRRAYFTVMDWIMKPPHDLLKGARVDRKAVQTAAYRLANLTAMMPELFAKDERSSNVPTRAKAAVWGQPVDFNGQLIEFARTVQGLLIAVRSNDEESLRQAIRRVDESCAACHEKFRENGNKDVGAITP